MEIIQGLPSRKLGRTWRKRQHVKTSQHRPHILLDTDYIDLLKWAKQNGAVFDNVRPAVFHETGRGMIATKNIRSNQEIISIPEKLLITTQTALDSIIGTVYHNVTAQRNVKITGKCLLCLYLIYLKFLGEKSFWFSYIKTLPATFNTPSYFNDKELKLLPTSCYKSSISQIHDLKTAFETVQGVCGERLRECNEDFYKAITYENFRWAWFVINTRSVYLKCSKEHYRGYHADSRHDNNYALAPVLDLLNHSDTVEVDAGVKGVTGSYSIATVTQYTRGQQVFINYGPHDNTTLFIEYGFILPINIHSSYKFDPEHVYRLVNLPKTNIAMTKLRIIKANNFEKDFSCSFQHGLSWNFLTSLRILALQDEELNRWQQLVYHGGHSSSANNASTIERWIVLIVESVLETLVTEDECLIKDRIQSTNMRLALELRNQEREILDNVLCQFKTK